MEEKKNKLIDLKGANSTMKLGLVLYAVTIIHRGAENATLIAAKERDEAKRK